MTAPNTPETKHDKFLRLMQGRLGVVLDKMRLVGQLSTTNYEYQYIEVEEVITHLDKAIHKVAQKFKVPFASYIGAAAVKHSKLNQILPSGLEPNVDIPTIAKAIDLIDRDRSVEASKLLKNALRGMSTRSPKG